MHRSSKNFIWLLPCALIVLLAALFVLPDSGGSYELGIPGYIHLLPENGTDFSALYEHQAQALIGAGAGSDFRADISATVVIAVDRSRMSESITGWKSLEHGDYTVSIHSDYNIIGVKNDNETYNTVRDTTSLLALSHKITAEGEIYETAPIMKMLRELRLNKRLVTHSADVTVLLDFQAAQMIKAGRNIEIIIPEEGTLTYKIGVMSAKNAQLPTISPEELIAQGFRLTDGTCDPALYPNASAYSSASYLIDGAQFMREALAIVPSYRRYVLGERQYTTASGTEHRLSYILAICAMTLWGCNLLGRISNPAIFRSMTVIVVLLTSWMVVRLLKLQFISETAVRYSWYAFYLFFLFIPIFCLQIGIEIAALRGLKKRKAYIAIPSAISASLLALIMTNDLHQLVFVFPEGLINFEHYTYGVFGYITFAWVIALIGAFCLFIGKHSKGFPAQVRFTPYIVLLIGLAYFAGYGLRVPFFRNSEMSITYGTLILVFIEISLRTGIIPSNRRYGSLLRYVEINLQILNKKLRREYATSGARELPDSIREQLAAADMRHCEMLSLSDCSHADMRWDAYRIKGGYALIAKDLSEIHRLRNVLEGRSHSLRERIEMLALLRDNLANDARTRAKQTVLERVSKTLDNKISCINELLSSLPESAGSIADAESLAKLARVKLLLNYCKRRAGLILQEIEENRTDTASLALWLHEELLEAETAGISGAVGDNFGGEVSMANAALLYDCFCDLIEQCAGRSVHLLSNISGDENGISMRVAMDGDLPPNLAPSIPPEQALSFEMVSEDTRIIAAIRLPWIGGGDVNA